MGEQIVFPFPLIAHKLRWQVSPHRGFIPKKKINNKKKSLELNYSRLGLEQGWICLFPDNSFCNSPNSRLGGSRWNLPHGFGAQPFSPGPNSFSFPRAAQGFPAVPGKDSQLCQGPPALFSLHLFHSCSSFPAGIPGKIPAFPSPLAPSLLPISPGEEFPQNLIFHP